MKHPSVSVILICVLTAATGCTASSTATPEVAEVIATQTPAATPVITIAPTACLTSITVEAYYDINADDQRDKGEPPLDSFFFGLLRQNVPAEEALIVDAVTGADGQVSLEAPDGECLAPDTVVALLSGPEGYHTTGSGIHEVAEGQQVQFGFIFKEVTPRPTPTRTTPLGDDAPQLAGIGTCSLVTESEVEAATGINVPQRPEGYITNIVGGSGEARVCDYIPAAIVRTNIPAPTDDIGMLLEWMETGDTEDVPNLGDHAAWVLVSKELVVRHRNVLIEIKPMGGGKAAAIELARLALPRLDDFLDNPDRPTKTPAAQIDACDVLSISQAETILGELTRDPEVGSAISEAFGIVSWCTYTGADAAAMIQFTRYGSEALAAEDFNNLRPPGDTIEGLGDEAAISADGLALLILRGTVTISITMFDGDPQKVREQAIALGRIVIVRIP
jgi:hypothetical protein